MSVLLEAFLMIVTLIKNGEILIISDRKLKLILQFFVGIAILMVVAFLIDEMSV